MDPQTSTPKTEPNHELEPTPEASDAAPERSPALGPARPRRRPRLPRLPRLHGLARLRRLRLAGRVAVGVLLVLAPFAGALTAIGYAPPARVEIAGQHVSVKPVIGQNTTQLSGAIVRPEHGEIPLLGKDVGLDLSVDWNHLIPQDKSTRRYLTQLWDDPEPEIARIRSTAQRYVIVWGSVGFAGTLALEAGTLLVLRQRRRKLAAYPPDDAARIAAHNARLRRTAAAVALLALVGLDVAAVRTYTYDDQRTVVGSPVFAGTSLAGTEVDGLVGEVVPFLSILEPRSDFYDQASDNLDQALADVPALKAGKDQVLFIAGEDLEDVNGMARLMGRAADDTDASFLAYTGDLTFAGKSVETYLIDTIDYYSGGVPVEFAPGLHDTDTITSAAQARGWRVADGTAHDVDGVSILTAADPRISTVGDFGSGTVLRDPDVDVPTFLTDTGDEICRSQPDFVLLHDHLLGKQLAALGCAKVAVIDGRSFSFVGPTKVPTDAGGTAVEYTNGSGGGHTTTSPDPGTIKHPATFTAFVYDTKTHATHYSVITVKPNAGVTVTPPISLHVPYADFQRTGETEPPTVSTP